MFCCAKPYTGEEEEDETVVSVAFSSGESGEDENRLGREFLKMKERDKKQRVRTLWYGLLAKAKGAVLVLDRFSWLTRRIYLFGTNQKLKYQIEQDLVPSWYIILPESKLRLFWNIVVLSILVYTACF